MHIEVSSIIVVQVCQSLPQVRVGKVVIQCVFQSTELMDDAHLKSGHILCSKTWNLFQCLVYQHVNQLDFK